MGIIQDIKDDIQQVVQNVKLQQLYAKTYKNYLDLNDKSKIGSYEELNLEDGSKKIIIYTSKGPIIKTEIMSNFISDDYNNLLAQEKRNRSLSKSSITYEGFYALDDGNRKNNYKYGKVGIALYEGLGPVDDKEIIHDSNITCINYLLRDSLGRFIKDEVCHETPCGDAAKYQDIYDIYYALAKRFNKELEKAKQKTESQPGE